MVSGSIVFLSLSLAAAAAAAASAAASGGTDGAVRNQGYQLGQGLLSARGQETKYVVLEAAVLLIASVAVCRDVFATRFVRQARQDPRPTLTDYS